VPFPGRAVPFPGRAVPFPGRADFQNFGENHEK